ncbi:MAG: hypothetical protein R2788_03845 [Saprospiraceae bacterium]
MSDLQRGASAAYEAGYVKIGGMDIMELVEMPIDELLDFFQRTRKPKKQTAQPADGQ